MMLDGVSRSEECIDGDARPEACTREAAFCEDELPGRRLAFAAGDADHVNSA